MTGRKKKTIILQTAESILPKILYAALFISIIFCFRAVTSITIGFMIIAGILVAWSKGIVPRGMKTIRILLLVSLLFLFLQTLGIINSADVEGSFSNLRLKSAIILVPFAFAVFPLKAGTRILLVRMFTILLFASCWYCLVHSLNAYVSTKDASYFFYHRLAAPISQHAVYLSFLVLATLIVMLESMRTVKQIFRPWPAIILIFFFTAFILLLSSKLMIGLMIGYLMVFFSRNVKWGGRNNRKFAMASAGVIGLFMIAVFIRNPVGDRFREIMRTDISILDKEKYSPGDYFDGMQFRLLQWKFVGQILTSEQSWLTGIGTGDAQAALDKKFLEMNMYAGDPLRGSRGYLGYNAHNQFLETLLQSGIPGLICLLGVFAALFRVCIQNKVSLALLLILFAWSFTESILEVQYGLIYLFLPLLFVLNGRVGSQPLTGKTRFDKGREVFHE